MIWTYLEQFCADETLNIDQRKEVIHKATNYSQKVDEVSTVLHLIRVQLFYFNGDTKRAYHHLELYFDGRLTECKLKCYNRKQRVRQ